MSINWKKGLIRAWLVVTCLWITVVGTVGYEAVSTMPTRYYYDPSNHGSLQTYIFGLPNQEAFAKRKTIEIRYSKTLSVVFLTDNGKDILLPNYRHLTSEQIDRGRPTGRSAQTFKSGVGAVVPREDLPDRLKRTPEPWETLEGGHWVPDYIPVAPTQADVKPIMDRALRDLHRARRELAVKFTTIAALPPLGLLLVGMLLAWIVRGFRSDQ